MYPGIYSGIKTDVQDISNDCSRSRIRDNTIECNNVPCSWRYHWRYTIAASSTGDNVQLFKNSGAACNTGALTNSATSNASLNCWLNASSTPVTIINRTMPVFNGYGEAIALGIICG